MAEFEKINEMDLEQAAGGGGASRWNTRTVTGLEKGYLAVRTAPCYDDNEIPGAELYNGDTVRICANTSPGTDVNGNPCTYAYVYVEKYGVNGYVNAAYLG